MKLKRMLRRGARSLQDFAAGLIIVAMIMLLASLDAGATDRGASGFGAQAASAPRLVLSPATGRTRTVRHPDATDATIDVTGVIARVGLTHIFRLPADGAAGQGHFSIGLPRGAEVDTLAVEIDDQRVTARVAPRGRQTRGLMRDGAMPEMPGDNADPAGALRVSIGDISQAASVTVRYTYQQLLEPRDGHYAMTVPAGAANGQDASALTASATIRSGFPLESVASPGHAIDFREVGEGVVEGRLASSGRHGTGQIRLEWRTEAVAWPRVATFREAFGDDTYVMTMIQPPRQRFVQPDQARDVIFVLDGSGSMKGRGLAAAKALTRRAIGRLGQGDRFNVVSFGNGGVRTLFDVPVPATAWSRQRAADFIRRLQAGESVPMRAALEAVFAMMRQSDATRSQQAVILSDGLVPDAGAALAAVAAQSPALHLNTIDVARFSGSAFLKRLSAIGRGAYAFADPAEGAFARGSDLLDSLGHVVLRDLQTKWPSGAYVDGLPAALPDLLIASPLVTLTRLSRPNGSWSLSGYRGTQRWSASGTLSAGRPGSGIARLWAKRKLDVLEARTFAGRDTREIAAAMVKLGLSHGVNGPATRLQAITEPVFRRVPAGQWAADDANLDAYATDPGEPVSAERRYTEAGPETGRVALVQPRDHIPVSRIAPADGSADNTGHGGGASSGEVFSQAASRSGLSDRTTKLLVVALVFATMCAVTGGFWRYLLAHDRARRGGPRRL